ncbi:MAG: DUF4258 domain-containing protein [Pirellulales bacterium]|nr:DUF4258 domain-containing protein [Pirellulales bacterium]
MHPAQPKCVPHGCAPVQTLGQHAIERLEERGILEWQVVVGLDDGESIDEWPDALPNPKIEVEQTLPDGTQVKAVWSYLAESQAAKLVTVHYFDLE